MTILPITLSLPYVFLFGFDQERSLAITSFAICGFSNVASIGIMMGALIGMIPERKSELSELVIRAILVGNITSFMTACFSGKALNIVE